MISSRAEHAAKPARLAAATPRHCSRPWPLPIATSPALEALTERVATAPSTQRAALADDLAAQLLTQGSPIIEAGDEPGRRLVSFLHRGEPGRPVYLQANRITDPMDLEDTRMRQVPGTGVSALTLSMPEGWIATYQFLVPDRPVPTANPHRPPSLAAFAELAAALESDPACPEQLPSKHGAAHHSVIALPGCPPAPEADGARGWVPFGEPGAVRGPASGGELPLTLLRHPRADPDAPLVLLLDGEVWLRDQGALGAVWDDIEAGTCPPLRLAFLASTSPTQRQLDLACEPEESARLLEAVRGRVGEDRGPWLVAGQSLGGLFAALCAVRHGDRIAAAIAQSPSLWWPTEAPEASPPGRWFRELAAAGACAPTVLQCGRLEGDLLASCAHARAVLDLLGARCDSEDDLPLGGHDIGWWRRTLPRAITRLAGQCAPREAGA